MGNTKSILKTKFVDVVKFKSTSSQLKGVIKNDQINIKLVQNVHLIWLDANIDENNVDCRNTISQLHHIVNTINIFKDVDKFGQFLEGIGNEKICMIISGSLGQHIVPCIHNMSQVESIFIFCGNKKYHEQWANNWSKVKGVFTEITLICDALKKAIQEYEQNTTSFSLMATNGDLSKKNFDQLELMFIYLQILKEIILEIEFKQQHFIEFICYCRKVLSDNEVQLKNLDRFERQYHDETPISWYTHEYFLYSMLNRALRATDLDIIIKMAFYIGELHRQIEKLHKEQFIGKNSEKILTVYRGQGMSKDEFQKIRQTVGGVIAFNNFLSNSKKREVSLDFARRSLVNPNMVGVLFIMTLDPSKSTSPFASVADVGYYGDKEEKILFSMHTIFRIRQIESVDQHPRLFEVELELTSENDKDLRILTDRIREETFSSASGWYRLGKILRNMGDSNKAQQIYEILLEQETQEGRKGSIYYELGSIKDDQGEYNEAIRFYEKAIEINKKTRSLNDLDLAKSYNSIGVVYDQLSEYGKALSYYEKSLEIRQKSLPTNHPDLGFSYNKMGLIYEKMSKYSKACWFYERAIEIGQNSLPSNHLNLYRWKKNLEEIKKKM